MMSRPFDLLLPLEQAFLREAMLAVELLDPVTLERVSRGVKVTAVGLTSTPIVNFSELFVWLQQPTTNFQKLIIEPGTRPFERVEIPAAQVQPSPQVADVGLQRAGRVGGRAVAPQRVGQPLRRDHVTAGEHEQAEDRALPTPAQVDLGAVAGPDRREGPQDAQVQPRIARSAAHADAARLRHDAPSPAPSVRGRARSRQRFPVSASQVRGKCAARTARQPRGRSEPRRPRRTR